MLCLVKPPTPWPRCFVSIASTLCSECGFLGEKDVSVGVSVSIGFNIVITSVILIAERGYIDISALICIPHDMKILWIYIMPSNKASILGLK